MKLFKLLAKPFVWFWETFIDIPYYKPPVKRVKDWPEPTWKVSYHKPQEFHGYSLGLSVDDCAKAFRTLTNVLKKEELEMKTKEILKIKRDIKGLIDSIEHWKEDVLRELGLAEAHRGNCPLCLMYFTEAMSPEGAEACLGCPIFEKTGEKTCQGTPYPAWCTASMGGDSIQAMKAGIAMVEFMYEILNEKHSELIKARTEQEKMRSSCKFAYWVEITDELKEASLEGMNAEYGNGLVPPPRGDGEYRFIQNFLIGELSVLEKQFMTEVEARKAEDKGFCIRVDHVEQKTE